MIYIILIALIWLMVHTLILVMLDESNLFTSGGVTVLLVGLLYVGLMLVSGGAL